MKLDKCLLIPGKEVAGVATPTPWASMIGFRTPRIKIMLSNGTVYKVRNKVLIWSTEKLPATLVNYTDKNLDEFEQCGRLVHYNEIVADVYAGLQRRLRSAELNNIDPLCVVDQLMALNTRSNIVFDRVVLLEYLTSGNKAAICACIHYLTRPCSLAPVCRFYGYDPVNNVRVDQYTKQGE